MSYCRFGEADIYLFLHVGGGIECCMCSLANRQKFVVVEGKPTRLKFAKKSAIAHKLARKRREYVENVLKPSYLKRKYGYFYTPVPRFYTYDAVYSHLSRHISLGDYIPEHVFDRLKKEHATAINDLVPSRRQYGKNKKNLARGKRIGKNSTFNRL